MNEKQFQDFLKTVNFDKIKKSMALNKVPSYDDIAPNGGFPLCDGYPFSQDNSDKFLV